jgi:hypothetical protein
MATRLEQELASTDRDQQNSSHDMWPHFCGDYAKKQWDDAELHWICHIKEWKKTIEVNLSSDRTSSNSTMLQLQQFASYYTNLKYCDVLELRH